MDKKIFYDQVIYSDKNKYVEMRCYDCGSRPVLAWNETQEVSGKKIRHVVSISCPNGPHEKESPN